MQGDQLLMAVSAPGIGGRVGAWYQWGKALSVDAEGLPIWSLITDSVPVAGDPNGQTIRLNAPFPTPVVLGAAITIEAGCNLDFFSAGGCPKFNNEVNFGGHPYIAQNLTLKAVDTSTDSGK